MSNINLSSGKIRTSKDENIALQKLFIQNNYTFLNGSKEVKERDDLDYFYFENGIISVGSRKNVYNNNNIFNPKFWDGETNFKKSKLKEVSITDLTKKKESK